MTFSSTLPLFGDREIVEFNGEHRFLSNFYPCEIHFEGKIYPSTEHAYVAAKTLNEEHREKIRTLSAGQAKRFGRHNIIIRDDWEEVKLEIMEYLVTQKFSSGPLKRMLIDTGSSSITEGNWWGDKFWGVDLETGVGKNHLGEILMKIRKEINHE